MRMTVRWQDAHDDIVGAWGEPSTEKYRRNVELANRALRELGGDGLAQSLRVQRGDHRMTVRSPIPAIGVHAAKGGRAALQRGSGVRRQCAH